LPFDPSAAINAARMLAQWELKAAVPPDRRHSTPLFCGEGGVGTPLRAAALDDVFHRLLAAVVGPEQAKLYSVHSFRSFLCSSLMAAGCTDAQIQAAVRWASEDALKIYKVTNREAYGDWLVRAERAKLTGERATTLHVDHRHMPITSHDELVASFLGERDALEKTSDTADAADERAVAALGIDGFTAGVSPEAALFETAAAAPRDDPRWRGPRATADEVVAAATAAVAATAARDGDLPVVWGVATVA